MKIKNYLIVVLMLLTRAGISQTTFVTSLGVGTNDQASGLVQTADSGYAVIGSTTIGSNKDVLLARIDKNGTLLWQKRYGGTGSDIGLAVVELPWGGFLFTANTKSYGTGGDVMLVKTDANGDTLWTKVYGTSGDDYGMVLEITNGGNYRINGLFYAGGTNKPGVMTVDSNGVFIAAKFVANQFASPDYRAHYLHGNKMGITGGSEMLIFTDTLGVYSGMLNYGTGAKSIDACYLPGGYYASVYWADYGSASMNTGLFLADTTGVKVWNKKFSTAQDDVPFWVKPDGHGGILLAIMRRDPNTYIAAMVLMAVDIQGNVKWQHTYGTNANYDHLIGNAIPTLDGGYAMVGSYTVGGSASNYDILFYKTDSLGVSGCDYTISNATDAVAVDNTSLSSPSAYTTALANSGTNVTPVNTINTGTYAVRCSSVSTSLMEMNTVEMNIWPNPVKDKLHINVSGKLITAYSLTDLSGRLHASGNSIEGGQLNVSELQNGIYFLKITTDEGNAMVKFVKQ